MTKKLNRAPKQHKIMTAGLSGIVALAMLSPAAAAFGATQNPDGSVNVQSGDTLSAIAQQFGGDYHEYAGYKSGNPDLIFPKERVFRKEVKPTAQKTIDYVAEAKATYAGQYGNDPQRHDALVAKFGADGAAKIQQLVNLLANGQALPDNASVASGAVSAPATQPSAQQGESFTKTVRVWITDKAGYFQPVFGYKNVNHPAQYQTITHPAVTHVEHMTKPAWQETVHHPAIYKDVPIYKTVHHDATYKTIQVQVGTKQVVDKPAWDETIHHDATYKTVPLYISSDGKFQTTDETKMAAYNIDTGTTYSISSTQVVDKPAYDETVHHDATYKTVPVYEDKTVVDKPAYDEQVQVGTDHQLVKAAWDETVNHPATTVDKTVVDKPAWNENKLVRNAYTSREYVQVGSRWIAAQGHWATR